MNSSVRRGHGPGVFDVWPRGQWLRELHICALCVCVCVGERGVGGGTGCSCWTRRAVVARQWVDQGALA